MVNGIVMIVSVATINLSILDFKFRNVGRNDVQIEPINLSILDFKCDNNRAVTEIVNL